MRFAVYFAALLDGVAIGFPADAAHAHRHDPAFTHVPPQRIMD